MIDKKSLKFQAALAARQSTGERDYWLNTLAGLPDKVGFPFDRKKGVNKRRPETVNRIFPGEILLSFSRISKGVDHALHMVLTAALLVLLHKYSGSDDIVVGMPIYKQSAAAEFVNRVVALRNRITANMTFKEILLQVRQTITEAVEYQNYPIEILAEQLNRPMDGEGNDFPLFAVVILLQNIHDKTYIEDIPTDMVWCFNLNRSANRLEAAVEYNALLYKEDTVSRVIDHWIFLVQQVLANKNLPVCEVSLITGPEKKQLLEMVNGPAEPLDMEQTIHGLFEEQVARSNDGCAVIAPGAGRGWQGVGAAPGGRPGMASQHLTYKELNKKSGQLAHLLREKGVKPDTIVGICVEPSIEMIIGALGILRAGGAYLPIDPGYPWERIDFMLKDSGVRILVSELGEVSKVSEECEVVGVSVGNRLARSAAEDCPHLSPAPAGSLAYVIYTSGTTGKPKGVMIRHESLINLCYWHNRHFSVSCRDRASKYAGFGFDASVWEIFPYLIAGAAVDIVPEEIKLDLRQLQGYMEKHHITISFLPTHICEQFTGLENHSLRVLLTGGAKLRRFVKDVKRNYRLVNNYGPTENTVVSTSIVVEDTYENIPIGRPITNSSAFILDKNGYPVPIGAAGELAVGGEGVARGYMNRPELTAEKFIFVSSRKIYKTGDLARWLPDGNIEFLGRMDFQVKIRGFRIELGEIESRLLKHPGIKDVVVIDREVEGSEKYLCAYIVPADSAGTPGKAFNREALREFLSQSLPDYMIPAYFVTMDRIPLTPNNKVDRKKLPEPKSSRPQMETAYLEPSTRLEKLIADAWKEILRLDKIGIDDNFFDLGGDSFKLVQAGNKLTTVLNKEVAVMMLFQYPTVRSLAQYLKEEGTGDKTTVVEQKAHLEKKLDKGKARLRATRKKIK
jgi:amino acid adenylation domain-containing protein